MTTVVIVLTEDGLYEAAFTDSEINFEVLRRGENDTKIDKVESEMEAISE